MSDGPSNAGPIAHARMRAPRPGPHDHDHVHSNPCDTETVPVGFGVALQPLAPGPCTCLILAIACCDSTSRDTALVPIQDALNFLKQMCRRRPIVFFFSSFERALGLTRLRCCLIPAYNE